ncbi:MAG: prephenate dehydratase [Flavobacteriales bacterium]|nr:prephenate dehydratase [Flavobacteriia bacterium]NCP07131.1 prephenate dehydratase [Flavobacteriales bacterium]PIV93249.1 MAG: prephenate dehydratase [Flavobacteriaceae bacterium CG17_big_fil_post_rev_8_21_14_2_50_33_15]PIY09232.1 MAG: prephenate dehydratase [Flavobacteriaceae bacterium CG_4_10_14_3_um_filter_33_47]PJB19694.1 MAG: prephenate dehydratase [Flavobacteriaceae bacterium CG_4_9_14_3_um_filter_33_16]
MIRTVAIQGVKGSFHHIVSQEFFNKPVDVIECLTFDEVVESLISKESDAVIMALENSIAGSIIPNYALINKYDLHVVGEHYLDIQHNLMGLPNQTIDDIKEVYSHPMALLQCMEFFKAYPHIKLVEDKDTAEVAGRIHKHQLKGVGAIASVMAANIFELDILAHSIQTIKHNETRFAIVKRKNSEIPEDEINKASLKFETDHKRGSLATILNVMSDCKLSLTKIQSLPIIETPWKYSFFVDVTFENYQDFAKAKSILNIMSQGLKILGEYKNAKL